MTEAQPRGAGNASSIDSLAAGIMEYADGDELQIGDIWAHLRRSKNRSLGPKQFASTCPPTGETTSAAGRRRVRVGTVALLLLLLSLVGCVAPSNPASLVADPVGNWASSGPDGVVARLSIDRDGKLSMTDTPIGAILPDLSSDDPVDWDNLVDVDGTWSRDSDGTVHVVLVDVGDAPSVLTILVPLKVKDRGALSLPVNLDLNVRLNFLRD